MLNKALQSIARAPRAIVKINNEVMAGWSDISLENNIFYEADTFSLSFALSALPLNRRQDWWAAQDVLAVEIFIGFPKDPSNYDAAELKSFIYGNVDDLKFNPIKQAIEISGRDLTARLIDNKSTEKWQNLSASAIAKQIAIKAGLTPVVTETTTKAGIYYDIDHVNMKAEHSQWDLLAWLAQQENFNLYVTGKELHFEPKQTISADNTYLLDWQSPKDNGFNAFDGTDINFSRALTIAKGVNVTVYSYNKKTKKRHVASYPLKNAKGVKVGGSVEGVENHNFSYPDLTPEKCLQYAQSMYKEITAHELKMQAELVGDNILTTLNVIAITGTNSNFDQNYYPTSITRALSLDGYKMHVSAKNVSFTNEIKL